jgi:tricorn protease
MKFCSSLAGLLLAAVILPASADQTLLLRQPTLSQDKLAFVYAGDLWVAERDGSRPRRLTSSPAEESHPMFSPDGKSIAFAGSYEGNKDVYVVPVAGGQPRRLTWHPGNDIPLDWTPDGSAVAFVSNRENDHGRSGQLYHAALDGSFPQKQMEARIYRGTYNEAGDLAYISFGSGYNGLFGGGSGWKGYRGGTTPAVQIMNAARTEVITVAGAGTTNFNPLWVDGKLYFLSDRENKIFNLFGYDPANGQLDKISNEQTWDIRAAGAHGSSIVYEAGGRLKQLDLATGATGEIVIEITPDLPQLRPQWKSAAKIIQKADISTSGKRAVVTARGEVFTVPVKDGSARNLSATGTRREYTALWSPDGQQIAWISESDEGQEVVLNDQTASGKAKRFPLGPHFYQLEAWTAGDSPRLIYTDNHLGLHSLDLDSGRRSLIATSARREDINVASSPDGRWLAYTQEQANYHRDLVLHNLETGKKVTVSDGTADVASPAFSPDGKYLYFAASTNSGPLQVGLNMTSQERPFRAALYALVLSADEKSPLLPKSGDEEEDGADEDDNGKDEDEKGKDGEDKAPAPTRIDLEGLSDRIVALPVAERNYGNLDVGKDGSLFYVQFVQPGATNPLPGEQVETENRLLRFQFEEKEEKSLLTGVTGFAISSGGSHMIISKADGSLATAEIADEMEPEALGLGGLKVLVDPRQEWAQIFDEAWRMEQEYFYADNMHGLDWQAVYQQYRPLVEHVGRREDLNTLMVEMIAELQVGHNRTGGGDVHQADKIPTGLLGANLAIEDGRYRLERVYSGENWNPFVKAPLAEPGNEAHAGEYILAVNGRELTSKDNIFAALQGTVGEQVTLKVSADAAGKNARDILVEPVDTERQLRLWSWIENNRRQVDKATGGQVGYIYLPNTAGAGYTFFNRMFFAQVDKEALIIDERSNAGGQAANYITDVLSRKHLSGWADRDGLIFNTPAGAVHGPKLMLIDQDAGSGGDYLPHTFRYAGIGKLMGTRTWGGLIGISTNPQLMDGGRIVVPFFRFFDAEGNWSVENEGVAPDIEVTLDPIATNRGDDSQLDAAIKEIMAQLEVHENKVMKTAPPLPTELGQ